jgi:hypothetical protein
MTSCHSSICIARFARHTQSCVRIGRGPWANVERIEMRVSRSCGRDSRGIWWRSYVIYSRQLWNPPGNKTFFTLPLSVVAANSFASGLVSEAWSTLNVVLHASCSEMLAFSFDSVGSFIHLPTSGRLPDTHAPELSVTDHCFA